MKGWPAPLKAHLAEPVTTIAFCWLVTRYDGAVFGFTNHQADLVVDGVTYLASTGFTAGEVSTRAALNVDDLEVEGMLDAAGIDESDIIAGLWSFAEVECFIVNYRDLSMGVGHVRRGWLGEVRRAGRTFWAELRGMMQKLQQAFGRSILAACDADLGDTRCGVNMATGGRTVTTTVTTATSQRQFTSTGLTAAAGFFTDGSIEFGAGTANAGVRREIKEHATGGVITLQLPFPYPISVGESFTARAGCDKAFATCVSPKFANGPRFRGFPHVPGADRIMAGT